MTKSKKDKTDANNPQRPAVEALQRRMIEGRAFVRARLEASLAGAAAIALTPSAVTDRAGFVQLACDVYDRAVHAFDARVQTELLRIEMALASETNKKEETKS
jgi:hypothetical protein